MTDIKLMEKKDFEAKLMKDFPYLYADMYGDPMKTCMHWGITTGPGWYDLIYNLSAQLEKLILTLSEKERKDYKVDQVKSKFGGLRCYLSYSTSGMRACISHAENLSFKTCEKCGKVGQLCGDMNKGEWLYTSCKDHANKQHKGNFK